MGGCARASKSCRSMRTRQYPAPRTHDRGSSRCCRKSQKSVLIPPSCGRPTVWDATNTFWRWQKRKSATRDARFTCLPRISRRRDPKRPHRGIDGGHGGVLQPPAVAEHPARHGLQRAARPVQRPQAVRLRRGQVHEEVHP